MIKRAKVEDAEILAALALQMWTDHDPEDMAKEFRELVMIHMAPGSEEANRIIVCTNSKLAALKNYESVGFQLYDRKPNGTESAYSGDYLYYEIVL